MILVNTFFKRGSLFSQLSIKTTSIVSLHQPQGGQMIFSIALIRTTLAAGFRRAPAHIKAPKEAISSLSDVWWLFGGKNLELVAGEFARVVGVDGVEKVLGARLLLALLLRLQKLRHVL